MMKSGELSPVTLDVSEGVQPTSSLLGDLLLREHFITREQLDQVNHHQRVKGGRLGQSLIKLGFLTEEILHSVLSRQFGLELIDPESSEIEADVIKLLPRELAVRLQVIPIRREGTVLFVAMSDPNDVSLFDELAFRTGLRVKPVLASEQQIRDGINRHFGSHKDHALKKVFAGLPGQEEEQGDNLQILGEDNHELDPAALKTQSEEAPIVRLVNFILVDSLRNGASDIHIEPYEKELRIRFRVDGILKTVMNPPVKL